MALYGRRGNNGGTGEPSSQPETQACSHFQTKFTCNVEKYADTLLFSKNNLHRFCISLVSFMLSVGGHLSLIIQLYLSAEIDILSAEMCVLFEDKLEYTCL